jgi:hypothetical protein
MLAKLINTVGKNTNSHLKCPLMPTIYFCSKSYFSDEKKRKIFDEEEDQEDSSASETGTEYTNWILARSQNHNHDISHLKRKLLKDRFSIHKLTNIKFLCALANHKTEYTLNTN